MAGYTFVIGQSSLVVWRGVEVVPTDIIDWPRAGRPASGHPIDLHALALAWLDRLSQRLAPPVLPPPPPVPS